MPPNERSRPRGRTGPATTKTQQPRQSLTESSVDVVALAKARARALFPDVRQQLEERERHRRAFRGWNVSVSEARGVARFDRLVDTYDNGRWVA